MNDFEAPAPSKGMPSWSDGVTLSYGEDGVRLTRHRWRFQHRRKDNVKDTLWDSEDPINEPRCM